MTNEDWSIKMQRHMYTNLMVIDLLFYYLYRPAKKSSVEKY